MPSNNGPSPIEPRTHERGQSTALVTSMLMVMMLFVGVVIDVGQAVNRRVAVQLIADTGAYTGAAAMAKGLNQLAYWNEWLQDIWAPYSYLMFSAIELYTFPLCETAESINNAYQAASAPFEGFYTAVNTAYANYPYMEARRVSAYNINDLFPGELDRFRFGEWSPFDPETGVLTMKRDYLSLMSTEKVRDRTWPSGDLGGLRSKQTITYGCIQEAIPPYPTVRSFNPRLWQEKTDDAVKYFVWIVEAPSTNALMFDSLFGGDVIPEMRAIAVAKAVGGSIVDADSEYVTKMVPASEAMTAGGLIWDSKYDRMVRWVRH